jgi:hypothetical protein
MALISLDGEFLSKIGHDRLMRGHHPVTKLLGIELELSFCAITMQHGQEISRYGLQVFSH